MAFFDYIILEGYRYKTLAKQWRPATLRAATPRLTLRGELEATFGVGTLKKWEGLIAVPNRVGETAPTLGDYGDIETLRAALQLRIKLLFTDHYGVEYEAVAEGPFEEQSLVNVWNARTNKYYVRVSLTAKAIE